MIPIENSLHGRVADIHFLLPESGLVIVGEYFLPIRYALMGLERRDDIRQAMSHPQALGQCRHWLKARGIEPVRSEEHTSELQSLMRISYAVFCLKKKTKTKNNIKYIYNMNNKHCEKNR